MHASLFEHDILSLRTPPIRHFTVNLTVTLKSVLLLHRVHDAYRTWRPIGTPP